MAIFEKTIRNQKFNTLLRKLEQEIPDSSWSADLEAGSDFKEGEARCSVRVFERYSMVGGNRLSLTLTMFQNGVLYTIIGNISTWNKNNHSPRLTVPATVVAKRTEVSRHHTDNTMMHTFTTYYATFQVESGDRMELEVDGSDYGMLVEGDIGKLMFQGTRYLGFERR